MGRSAHWTRPAVKSLDISQWWTIFGDPKLNSLIERAVQANLDLQIAEARIREARAQRLVVAAAAYPEIDVAGALFTQLAPVKMRIPRRKAATPGG